MKLLHKTFKILLIGFCAYSCTVSDNTDNELIVVDLTQDLTVETDLKLSDIAKNISYTKLDSKEGCFIQHLSKYSIAENNILVYDRMQDLIFLFEKDGNFIKRISRKGNGPGEYNRPNDVRISSCEKYILIHERKAVKRYNLEGEFLGSTTLPSWAMHVDTFEDELIGTFPSSYSISMDNYTFVTFDWEGNITGQYGKRNWDWFSKGMPMKRPKYYRFNNNVCFYEDYYDTVYSLTSEKKFIPRIYFKSDFDAEKKRHKMSAEDYRQLKGFMLDGWLETDEHIFIGGPYNGKLHPLVFSKESNGVFHFPYDMELGTFGIPNDIDGGSPFWPARYQNGKYYRLEYANKLKHVLDNELIDKASFTNQKLRDNLLELKKNLKDDDGLILIEVDLK